MAVSVTVAGITYQVPSPNDELWGVNTTDYLVALGEELANVVVVGDIPPEILVNIAASGTNDVTDFILDSSLIQAATAEYYIQRISDSPLELVESGTLYFNYNDAAGEWSIAQVGSKVGETLVTFAMNVNQLQYTASAMSGTYISGKMRFRVRALPK
jgi:hypothetical protein